MDAAFIVCSAASTLIGPF